MEKKSAHELGKEFVVRNPLYHPDAYHLDTYESLPLLLRVTFQKSSIKPNESWLLAIELGRGAGFVLGRTAYVAKNCFTRTLSGIVKQKWKFDFTNNLATVPFLGIKHRHLRVT